MAGNDHTNSGFEEKFWGRFSGVLRWPQLDALWKKVRVHPDGWYIYSITEDPPETPASSDALFSFLREADRKLRQEHEHDYCGIVYADDLESPTMIKIYHPGNLGASCGSSGVRILPRWVLSRARPAKLAEAPNAGPQRYPWWQRILRNA